MTTSVAFAMPGGGMLFVEPDPYLRAAPFFPGGAYRPQRLDGDPVGLCSLTLQNLVVGSRIRLEVASTGETVDDRVASSTDEVFALSLYAPGSLRNSVRIKVRNASGSPAYRPYTTQATLAAQPQVVFVFQEPDE